jgi:hypothetical protein
MNIVVTANNDNNDDILNNIQNAIKTIDVNSYKIRYCDYCKNDSSNIGTETEENQAVNCKKIVIILQERSIEE